MSLNTQDKKQAFIQTDSKSSDPEIQVVADTDPTVFDAVFGEAAEGATNYTNVGWLATSVIMMKCQIGLGVLSMPYVFSVLGAVPGVIMVLLIGGMTTWSNLEVGKFKLRHPECYSLSDVGQLTSGTFGRELYGWTYFIFCVAVVGSSFIGISTALNAITIHGLCTAGFIGIVAIVAGGLASIRTLQKVSWVSWAGLVSILAAILTVTIAVGIQDRPSDAPATGPWEKDLRVVNSPTYADAMLAISNIVFSYAGTPAFLPIASEMRNRRDFVKATILCQSVVTAVFLGCGIVVYFFCGQYVASPALGSAGPLLKRVSYGLALPGLFATATIFTHLPAKWLLIRLLRGTTHLTSNSARYWVTWLGCIFGCVLISYIFASAVPSFNSIVGLVGALFGTFLCFQTEGFMYLYDYRQDKKAGIKRNPIGAYWSYFMILAGTFILIGGTYGSIDSIITTYKTSAGRAFSCADNSNSVPAARW